MTGSARQPPRAVPGPVEGHGAAGQARARLLIGRPGLRARTERGCAGPCVNRRSSEIVPYVSSWQCVREHPCEHVERVWPASCMCTRSDCKDDAVAWAWLGQQQ